MKNIETALGNVDFSRFSKVHDSLKAKLLDSYDATRSNRQSVSILGDELSDDDLDMVVAAGATAAGAKVYNKNDKLSVLF